MVVSFMIAVPLPWRRPLWAPSPLLRTPPPRSDTPRGFLPKNSPGLALIGAAAAGIVGAALFTTDPISGYPPGTPDTPTDRTTAGTAHDLAAIPTFFGLPMAAAVYSWRFAHSGQPGWAAYSASTAVSMLATLGLSAAGFNQAPRLVDNAGRWQRLCIATGFTWLTALIGPALHQS